MRTDAYTALVRRLACGRQRLIGAAVARVLLGAAALHIYLASYSQRHFIWGPRGINPLGAAEAEAWSGTRGFLPSLSLYALSNADAWFEVVYHGGIVAALLFAVLGGRLLTLLHCVLLVSLFERMPLLLEGGDKLARILLLFLCAACTSAYLSPGAARRRAARHESSPTVASFAHNVALSLCVFQVAVVYLWSGLAKLEGAHWLDGTAVHYAARFDAMHFLPGLDWITELPLLGRLMTYGVVGLELLYPAMILFGPTRRLAVALAACMHVGIALKMGLVSFSLVMLAANALVLSDEDYRQILKRVRRRRAT